MIGEIFWIGFSGVLPNSPNLILGGDLNLTMNVFDIWGKRAVLDPLLSHFKLLFDSVGLTDISHLALAPLGGMAGLGTRGSTKDLTDS